MDVKLIILMMKMLKNFTMKLENVTKMDVILLVFFVVENF